MCCREINRIGPIIEIGSFRVRHLICKVQTICNSANYLFMLLKHVEIDGLV